MNGITLGTPTDENSFCFRPTFSILFCCPLPPPDRVRVTHLHVDLVLLGGLLFLCGRRSFRLILADREPAVRDRLRCGHASGRVLLQELRDEILRFDRDVVPLRGREVKVSVAH